MEKAYDYEIRTPRMKTMVQIMIIAITSIISIGIGVAIMIGVLSKISGLFDFKAMLCFTFIGICCVFILTEVVAFALSCIMGIK